MNAQRNAGKSGKPRGGFRRAPIRARVGLAMRRSMDFGPLGDVEQLMQYEGISMAPISTGDASMSVGGVTVLPTAKMSDIEDGSMAGLIIPGGAPDSAAEEKVANMITTARANGMTVLAFGEGVAQAARAMAIDPATLADAPGAVIDSEGATPLMTREQLSLGAQTLG